jgi:hypothetical protein
VSDGRIQLIRAAERDVRFVNVSGIAFRRATYSVTFKGYAAVQHMPHAAEFNNSRLPNGCQCPKYAHASRGERFKAVKTHMYSLRLRVNLFYPTHQAFAATQLAASVVRFDADEQMKIQMELDPRLVLSGAVPRLLDEWQEYPQIWNYVRREVDERKRKGQFILTGSATPDDKARRHSGAGRFSVVRMRPMSFFEKGWSTGEVSLSALMCGETPVSGGVPFDIGELADKIDTEKVKAPIALTVITGNGFAHRRADGVNVVPLSTLRV